MRDKQLKTVAATAARKRNYEFNLDSSDWVDTGATVAAGEVASFTASGKITLADGRATTPDGVDRGWKDLLRQFPLNSARVGALVGRVGNADAAVPFSIGASGEITMPTTGELYLRLNLSSDLSFTGDYKVKLKFLEPPKAKVTPAAPTVPSVLLSVPQPSPIFRAASRTFLQEKEIRETWLTSVLSEPGNKSSPHSKLPGGSPSINPLRTPSLTDFLRLSATRHIPRCP
jgi:hypothetical protein